MECSAGLLIRLQPIHCVSGACKEWNIAHDILLDQLYTSILFIRYFLIEILIVHISDNSVQSQYMCILTLDVFYLPNVYTRLNIDVSYLFEFHFKQKIFVRVPSYFFIFLSLAAALLLKRTVSYLLSWSV